MNSDMVPFMFLAQLVIMNINMFELDIEFFNFYFHQSQRLLIIALNDHGFAIHIGLQFSKQSPYIDFFMSGLR